MVVRRLSILVLLLAAVSFGGQPHVPPRNYSKQATVVLGDEAIALAKATESVLVHLRKRSANPSLSSYFARI